MLILSLFSLKLTYSHTNEYRITGQDDTIKAPDVATNIPQIDGKSNDSCWSNAAWQNIGNVWVPLNDVIDSVDFYGRFKIVWSSTSNLLYILAEITDDIRVDGYVYNDRDNTYPDYDVLELFIDEDKSGHEHVFDYFKSDGVTPGIYNSENAFSYHLDANSPIDNQVTHDFYACDIDGINWWPDGAITMNYADHFPEFALKRSGDKYIYEMSLIVYDTNYDLDPVASRVQLLPGKIMGFCLAFCDNDTPAMAIRQTFIGSVEPNLAHLNNEGNYDYMWENADDYGALELVENTEPTGSPVVKSTIDQNILVYPNPSCGELNIESNSRYRGSVLIKIYNVLGDQMMESVFIKDGDHFLHLVNIEQYPSGTYFLVITEGTNSTAVKFMKY